MREIRDESDNEDNEGVEADAGGTLHGGVWFFISSHFFKRYFKSFSKQFIPIFMFIFNMYTKLVIDF